MKSLKLIRTIMLGLVGGITGSCLSYRAWFAFALSIALAIVMMVYSFMAIKGDIPDEHGRLIDADALPVDVITDFKNDAIRVVLLENIEDAPTILETSK